MKYSLKKTFFTMTLIILFVMTSFFLNFLKNNEYKLYTKSILTDLASLSEYKLSGNCTVSIPDTTITLDGNGSGSSSGTLTVTGTNCTIQSGTTSSNGYKLSYSGKSYTISTSGCPTNKTASFSFNVDHKVLFSTTETASATAKIKIVKEQSSGVSFSYSGNWTDAAKIKNIGESSKAVNSPDTSHTFQITSVPTNVNSPNVNIYYSPSFSTTEGFEKLNFNEEDSTNIIYNYNKNNNIFEITTIAQNDGRYTQEGTYKIEVIYSSKYSCYNTTGNGFTTTKYFVIKDATPSLESSKTASRTKYSISREKKDYSIYIKYEDDNNYWYSETKNANTLVSMKKDEFNTTYPQIDTESLVFSTISEGGKKRILESDGNTGNYLAYYYTSTDGNTSYYVCTNNSTTPKETSASEFATNYPTLYSFYSDNQQYKYEQIEVKDTSGTVIGYNYYPMYLSEGQGTKNEKVISSINNVSSYLSSTGGHTKYTYDLKSAFDGIDDSKIINKLNEYEITINFDKRDPNDEEKTLSKTTIQPNVDTYIDNCIKNLFNNLSIGQYREVTYNIDNMTIELMFDFRITNKPIFTIDMDLPDNDYNKYTGIYWFEITKTIKGRSYYKTRTIFKESETLQSGEMGYYLQSEYGIYDNDDILTSSLPNSNRKYQYKIETEYYKGSRKLSSIKGTYKFTAYTHEKGYLIAGTYANEDKLIETTNNYFYDTKEYYIKFVSINASDTLETSTVTFKKAYTVDNLATSTIAKTISLSDFEKKYPEAYNSIYKVYSGIDITTTESGESNVSYTVTIHGKTYNYTVPLDMFIYYHSTIYKNYMNTPAETNKTQQDLKFEEGYFKFDEEGKIDENDWSALPYKVTSVYTDSNKITVGSETAIINPLAQSNENNINKLDNTIEVKYELEGELKDENVTVTSESESLAIATKVKCADNASTCVKITAAEGLSSDVNAQTNIIIKATTKSGNVYSNNITVLVSNSENPKVEKRKSTSTPTMLYDFVSTTNATEIKGISENRIRSEYLSMSKFLYTAAVTTVSDATKNISSVLFGTILCDEKVNIYETSSEEVKNYDVTDQFSYISSGELNSDGKLLNSNSTTIYVVPSTEVKPNINYYIYTTDDFSLNNSDGSPIDEDRFPEMWNRNIHMTQITYSNPDYTIEVDNTSVSTPNIEDGDNELYRNVSGLIDTNFEIRRAYDASKFNYNVQIEIKDSAGNASWSNTFEGTENKVVDSFNSIIESIIETNPVIIKDVDSEYPGKSLMVDDSVSELKLETIPTTSNNQKLQKGKYRIVLSYSNSEYSDETFENYAEFTIGGDYYGLRKDSNPTIEFSRNVTKEESFEIIGSYLSDPTDLTMSATLDTTALTVEKLDLKDSTYTFSEEDNQNLYEKGVIKNKDIVYFVYGISQTTDTNTNETKYTVYLKNIINNPISNKDYNLTFKYQEKDNNKVQQVSQVVSVLDNTYNIGWGTQSIKITKDESYIITIPFETEYFTKDDLKTLTYKVIDAADGTDYSANDDNKLFTISSALKEYDDVNTQSRMEAYITIDNIDDSRLQFQEDADNGFYGYILEIKMGTRSFKCKMNDILDLLNWQVSATFTNRFTNNDGELETIVEEEGKNVLYRNLSDSTIDIKIDPNIYEDTTPKYYITQGCYDNADIGIYCQPSSLVNYNSAFKDIEPISGSNDEFRIQLKENLTTSEMPPAGNYQLVIAYDDNDKRIINFEMLSEYIQINIGNLRAITYINSSTTVERSGLFQNKDGHVEIPIEVKGAEYDAAEITVLNSKGETVYDSKVSSSKYLFTLVNDKYTTGEEKTIDGKTVKKHYIYLQHKASTLVPVDIYTVLVSYNGTVKDSWKRIFKVSSKYFDYEVSDPTYDPNPAVPNRDNSKIKFNIDTNDMTTGDTASDSITKQKFVDNIKVYYIDEDTKQETEVNLTKDYENSSLISNFDAILSYNKDTGLLPGTYKVVFSYQPDDFSDPLVINKTFELKDFERNITIKNYNILSEANDSKLHINCNASIQMDLVPDYEIDPNDYEVVITNSKNETVTSKFNFVKEKDKLTINYIASTPYISADTYNITIIYTDPITNRVSNITTIDNNSNKKMTFKFLGEMKQITISDLTSSNKPIVAEESNQYYTIKLNTSNLDATDISNIKLRVYDKYGNYAYSSLEKDESQDLFGYEKIDDNNYKINILPFKARVGSYYVVMSLPDEEGDYYDSNRITFTVDSYKYDINLSVNSTITPSEIYNNDSTSFYDYPGFDGKYIFTSDYTESDYEYSIKVFNNGKLVEELKDFDIMDDGTLKTINSIHAEDTGVGEIDVALCLNGLPYDSLKYTAKEYIKITKVIISYDNLSVGDELKVNYGDNKDFYVTIYPENATNKELSFTSTNSGVVKMTGKNLQALSSGTSTITISNKEFKKVVNVTVPNRLISSLFEIDYSNNIIYINKLTNDRTLTKSKFLSNLENKVNGYKIYNKNNQDVTNTTSVVGTNYRFVNGNETYIVVLIGDLNGSGTIDIGDVSYLYQIYKGKRSENNQYVLKAAHVRRGTDITLGDVSKLYQFYKYKINAL